LSLLQGIPTQISRVGLKLAAFYLAAIELCTNVYSSVFHSSPHACSVSQAEKLIGGNWVSLRTPGDACVPVAQGCSAQGHHEAPFLVKAERLVRSSFENAITAATRSSFKCLLNGSHIAPLQCGFFSYTNPHCKDLVKSFFPRSLTWM
jgi:hypothetical protein